VEISDIQDCQEKIREIIEEALDDLDIPEADKKTIAEELLKAAQEQSAAAEDIENAVMLLKSADEDIRNAQGFARWALKNRAKPPIRIDLGDKKRREGSGGNKEKSERFKEKYRDIYIT